MMIPVFIFEEHHEAFFVWHYAVMKQTIAAKGNVLLHVDEHADFGAPRFSRSIDSLDRENLADVCKFTYNELTIENFIIPAMYQEIFKTNYWIQHPHEKLSTSPQSLCIYPYQEEGKGLIAKKYQTSEVKDKPYYLKWLVNPKYKLATFQHITVNDDFPENQRVVMDVDLDYFSCNPKEENIEAETRVEITEKEYKAVSKDRYNLWRLNGGSGVKTIVEDNRYYLLFKNSSNTEDISPDRGHKQEKVSEAEIVKRIEQLVNFLQKKKVQLQLVDICRSRISRFTPHDQWEFIEDTLLKELGKVYDLDRAIGIDEILAEQGLNQTLLMANC